MEMTIDLWKSMTGIEQTMWLQENKPANYMSAAKRKVLHGFGVNDVNYCTQPVFGDFSVRCPAYVAWANIISRCYGNSSQIKRPKYIGVKVCDEWLSFSAFRAWWICNQVDGWQIDKDLIGDSSTYSPSSCKFVPCWLNAFTIDSGASRGEYPIGVHFDKARSRFVARCRNPITGKSVPLGRFTDKDEAHLAWMNFKLSIAMDLRCEMDLIDSRIYPRVVEIIRNTR